MAENSWDKTEICRKRRRVREGEGDDRMKKKELAKLKTKK